MHLSTLEQLARERRHDLLREAACARASHEARGAAPSRGTNHRATRLLGEVLIRAGWRLVGTEAPASGIRTRLALPSTRGAMVDPC
jgi:hypothetical protein